MRPFVRRRGLWRRWRDRVGRGLYRLLQRLGVAVAPMVRYEAGPTTGATAASVPAAFSLDRWRADDPALPGTVPAALDPADVVVGATLDGDLVGYCVLSPRAVAVEEIGSVVDPSGVCLWDLYVTPGCRGRGLGTALLRRARGDELAETHGRVAALVAADNEPSRRAFRAAGFAPAELLVPIGRGDRIVRLSRPLRGDAGRPERGRPGR